MTDNEIIRALEFCSSDEVGLCRICPLDGECEGDINILLKFALGLINRQKAEIERANVLIKQHKDSIAHLIHRIDVNEAEAIKEFAERLKARAKETVVYKNELCAMGTPFVNVKDIDNLVKEMVGADNAE